MKDGGPLASGLAQPSWLATCEVCVRVDLGQTSPEVKVDEAEGGTENAGRFDDKPVVVVHDGEGVAHAANPEDVPNPPLPQRESGGPQQVEEGHRSRSDGHGHLANGGAEGALRRVDKVS